MNKFKNNLDEMQEQKLLKIEHHGAWLAFWGLLIAMIVQVMIGGEDLLRNVAGEWLVFMCLAIYMLVACMKNGIWDRKLKPNAKTNLFVSLVGGLICGIVFSISSYVQYQNLLVSLGTGAFLLILVFALTFLVLTIMATIHNKRAAKIEGDTEE